MEFEWDEQKRFSNLQKHGIDFVRACQIFENYTVDFEDNRYNYDEERFISIGETNGQILTVVYTYRGDVIRLISARKATKYEQTLYYSDNP
ncbi:BrnT family toxin [Rippkaea orientalis]|uniref:BrnT family toxin n=1 Tax=Rippkaea orientalis TaxID=2546366 RepID=UPI00193CBC0F|nr:BrnT family toxin [Rippkaea orientalis]